jgi:hypothetical protein
VGLSHRVYLLNWFISFLFALYFISNFTTENDSLSPAEWDEGDPFKIALSKPQPPFEIQLPMMLASLTTIDLSQHEPLIHFTTKRAD